MKKNTRCAAGLAVDILLAAVLIALYALTAHPNNGAAAAGAFDSPIYRGQAQGAAALQFAVDWDAAALPDILDTLMESGVHATFAVSGEWANSNADLLRRMAREGHEIATMGGKPDANGRLRAMKQDVAESVETIASITGEAPLAYYSGSRNVKVASRTAEGLGLAHVLCTIDLMCAKGTAADIAARASTGAFDGSIILLQPTGAVLDALPRILEQLNMKGLRAVRTRDIVNYGIL